MPSKKTPLVRKGKSRPKPPVKPKRVAQKPKTHQDDVARKAINWWLQVLASPYFGHICAAIREKRKHKIKEDITSHGLIQKYAYQEGFDDYEKFMFSVAVIEDFSDLGEDELIQSTEMHPDLADAATAVRK